MNEHDLYCAIGNVDEAFLLECENRPIRRIPKRFGLIAAIVALMLTACAVPVAIRTYDALKDGTITPSDYKYRHLSGFYVEVEVAISPGAPTSIEEIYLPVGMLDYTNRSSYTLFDGGFTLRCFAGEDRGTELFFYQTVFSNEDRSRDAVRVHSTILDGADLPEITQKTYGDIQAFEYIVDLGDRNIHYYFRNVMWSDGMYFYFLQIPKYWTEEQITDMLSSLSLLEGGVDALPEEVAEEMPWTG